MLPVLAQYHLFMFDTNLSPDADVTNGQQGCAEFALPMVTPKAECNLRHLRHPRGNSAPISIK